MGTVTSRDGTTIAFERRGEGPALILVAGAIQPTYRLPIEPEEPVRETIGKVGREGLEPSTLRLRVSCSAS